MVYKFLDVFTSFYLVILNFPHTFNNSMLVLIGAKYLDWFLQHLVVGGGLFWVFFVCFEGGSHFGLVLPVAFLTVKFIFKPAAPVELPSRDVTILHPQCTMIYNTGFIIWIFPLFYAKFGLFLFTISQFVLGFFPNSPKTCSQIRYERCVRNNYRVSVLNVTNV